MSSDYTPADDEITYSYLCPDCGTEEHYFHRATFALEMLRVHLTQECKSAKRRNTVYPDACSDGEGWFMYSCPDCDVTDEGAFEYPDAVELYTHHRAFSCRKRHRGPLLMHKGPYL